MALGQDLATLAKRVRSTDPPDCLPYECLIHLNRDTTNRRDESIAMALMPTLLIRCKVNLLEKVLDLAVGR